MLQALYSVAYLGIVAAAGLVLGVPLAWQMAAVTAALAFFAEEIPVRYRQDTGGVVGYPRCRVAVALLSWATGAAAGLSLLF